MKRNTVKHTFRLSISDHKSVSTIREVHPNLILEMLHWVCWLFWLCTLWRRKNWIIILCSRKYWNMYLTCNPTRNVPSIQSVFQIVLIKDANAVWWNEFCLSHFIWFQDLCTINLTSIGKPLSTDVNYLVGTSLSSQRLSSTLPEWPLKTLLSQLLSKTFYQLYDIWDIQKVFVILIMIIWLVKSGWLG